MAQELQLQVSKEAKDLPSLFREVAEKLSHPIIIAMKGHPCTGRRLFAFLLAATIRCPLIKEGDIIGESSTKQSLPTLPSTGVVEEANLTSYQTVCRIAASQIEIGFSVVVDSHLSSQSQFNQLQNLAKSTQTPLFIIECHPRDESELWRSLEQEEDVAFASRWWDKPSSLEGLRRLLDEFNTYSDYDIADIPKFMVDITPAGDIKNCVSYALQAIATHVEADHQAETAKCECHEFEFWDEQEKNQASCAKCLQHITGPIYRCNKCNFILHKSCTELPPIMQLPSDPFPLYLKKGEENEVEPRCNCCKELLKGCFYSDSSGSSCSLRLDLNCIFLPFKRRINLHEHQLQLSLEVLDFTCDACGLLIDQKISYTCHRCGFRIDPNCAWLPETTVYERHRHPFMLSLSPRDDSDQYYCNACEKERDPKHWIYYCSDCDFPAHTRCLVPSALPRSDSDNK